MKDSLRRRDRDGAPCARPLRIYPRSGLHRAVQPRRQAGLDWREHPERWLDFVRWPFDVQGPHQSGTYSARRFRWLPDTGRSQVLLMSQERSAVRDVAELAARIDGSARSPLVALADLDGWLQRAAAMGQDPPPRREDR